MIGIAEPFPFRPTMLPIDTFVPEFQRQWKHALLLNLHLRGERGIDENSIQTVVIKFIVEIKMPKNVSKKVRRWLNVS